LKLKFCCLQNSSFVLTRKLIITLIVVSKDIYVYRCIGFDPIPLCKGQGQGTYLIQSA